MTLKYQESLTYYSRVSEENQSKYIQTIYSDEGKNKISKGLDSFIDVALFDSEKSKANKLTNEDLDFQLAKYLKTDNDQKNSWKKEDSDYQKALKNDPNFLAGLNVCKGNVTYKAVAETFGHKFLSPSEALN